VAVSVVDMEFLAIDFNPCPPSDGNDPPNYFYNTSRCKPSTTVSYPKLVTFKIQAIQKVDLLLRLFEHFSLLFFCGLVQICFERSA
jgi:hypothetical protein